MTVTLQQSRLLTWLVCLLAASFIVTGFLANGLPVVVGTAFLAVMGVTLALKMKSRLMVSLVVGVIAFFFIGMFCLLLLTDAMMDGRYGSSNAAMAIGTPIHALFLTVLVIWIIRRLQMSKPGQSPKAHHSEPLSHSSGLPKAIAATALQGVVHGRVKRTVPFAITSQRSKTIYMGNIPYTTPGEPKVTYIDRTVLTFTVQRQGLGEDRRPLPPIQVKMEGYKIDGQLDDGDIVRFDASPVLSVVNTLSRIHNLSKGVHLVAHPIEESPQYRELRSTKLLVAVLLAILGGGLLLGVFSQYKKQNAAIQQRFPHQVTTAPK